MVALKRKGVSGCDDAPVVTVATGEPKQVTFVYPYYENREFLAFPAALWRSPR